MAAKRAERRAFIISPIGGERDGAPDARRAYADAVLARIVAPALKAAEAVIGLDITPVRGDHDRKTGDIVSKLVRAITEDEIVIALVSEHDHHLVNANVFYELGIAHCAGRPVIILKHEHQGLPFDLIGNEALQFRDEHLTGAADPMAPGGPGAAMARLIADLLREPPDIYRRPFDRDIALGRQGARDRFSSIRYPEWSDMLIRADRNIYLAGATLLQLIGGQPCFFLPDREGVLSKCVNLETLLAYQIGRGVDVNVLMLHEQNPIIEAYLPQGVGGASERRREIEKTRKEIAASHKLWKRAQSQAYLPALNPLLSAERPEGAEPGVFRVVKVRHGALWHRVCATDKRVALTPYFYTSGVNSGPCIDARAGTDCHRHALDDLDALIQLNEKYVTTASAARKFA
ncbi:MAG TPA: hypothetical protein PKY87_12205 [Terricaulis sp.]|nr:hypothetical protein [Terricaulis sp.]